MTAPDEMEAGVTLRAAVARFDELRTRQALAGELAGELDGEDAGPAGRSLDVGDHLELLALAEVITRKAGYGRQSTVRAARAAGASWSQIGRAMGSTKQSAWEAHNRWIDEQARLHEETDYEGLDEAEVSIARAQAGDSDQAEDA
jgi:hypothetical protein